MKFADDTTVVGLISGGDKSTHREEVEQLLSWCMANNLLPNNLHLNTKDQRTHNRQQKEKTEISPQIISRDCVERVADFCFLGVNIEESLSEH